MHIILQKPTQNSTPEAILHHQTHLEVWMKIGKEMNVSSNGTQQAIQASMASTNNAQINAPTPSITTNQ